MRESTTPVEGRHPTAQGRHPRFLGIALALQTLASVQAADPTLFSGCCDASAAVHLPGPWIATASDEENVLRIYRRDLPGGPAASFNFSRQLGTGKGREADLEGAATLGTLTYWIGSHSRNQDGKARPARHVLFAANAIQRESGVILEPFGSPYRGLATALAEDPQLAEFRFRAAAQLPGEASGGLNIEGLAAGPAGSGSLWIGFRNPVPNGLALIIPLLNPGEVMANQPARLGKALRLDLEGLGIRDMVRVGSNLAILAGPAEGGGRHKLFLWDGSPARPQLIQGAVPKNFQAEAIIADAATGRDAMIFSDDNSEKRHGKRCEDLEDPALRGFRAMAIDLMMP
jgi:hypothetical protein